MGKWALALVVVLGGVAWWLLRDDAAPPGEQPAALSLRAAPDAGAPSLPEPTHADAAPAALAVPVEPPPSDADAAADPRDELEVLRASGRVVDLDGRAVPHAEVLLLPDRRTQLALKLEVERTVDLEDRLVLRAEDLASTRADADGRFTLEGAWRRDLAARSSLLKYNSPTLLVRADGFALHAFSLAAFVGEPFDAGELVLGHSGGSLRARFVDEQGAPLEGVVVDLGMAWYIEDDVTAKPPQDPPYFRVDSDADGVWAVTHLWHGDYLLRVSTEVHEALEIRAELGHGASLDLGEFTLRLAGQLRGVVRDTHGAPVADARVTAADSGFGAALPDPQSSDADFLITTFPFQMRAGVVTDAEGRFTLPGLPRDAAPFRVIAAAEGFESAWLGDVAADSEGLELVLPPEARVEVSTVDAESGDEVADFELSAFRDINRWMPLTKPHMKQFLELRTSGRSVHGAGPFGTRLLITAPGYTQALRDVRGLQPGEVHHERVELRRAHALRFTCVDPDGAPVPEASVRFKPPAEWGSGLYKTLVHGRTDDAGALTLEGLAAGTWQLTVVTDGFDTHTDTAFEVAEADAEHTLVLQRSTLLTGTLFGPDGEPAPSQRVIWFDGRSRRHDQLTGPDGGFRIARLPGAGSLHAARTPVLELQLARGETRSVELHQRGSGIVAGRVVDAAGVPLEQTLVMLDGPTLLGLGVTDHKHVTRVDGRFTFSVDLPGVYELRAYHAGTELVESVEAVLDARVEVEVAFGGASLSGVVLTAGTGLDPAQLMVTLDLGDTRVARVRPDDQGRFAFTQLAPGDYFVGSYGGGSIAERWGPFELDAGDSRDDVELRPRGAAQVAGRAIHEDGGPFEGFVHLRCADGEHYEIAWIRWGDGGFDQRGLHPGAWRLDLAESGAKVLGAGFGDAAGAGEPGVELPFFAREELELAAGERRELTLIVPDAARR